MTVLTLLVLVLLVLLARKGAALPAWDRWMAGRAVVVTVAIVTALTCWSVVGWEHDPVAVIGDEASYKLQASLFAAGEWTDPASPFPDAFRQIHVLDQPRVASKYPPGHALLLAPGFLVGFPWLMPLLLNALSGALIFLIGRRMWSGTAGVLAWFAWLTATTTLDWQVSWYSQVTSTSLMLLGWWVLMSARFSTRGLLLVGAATGWLAITRPLTAVTFALPIGVVLLSRAWRSRTLRPVLVPVAAGLLPLLVLPLWSLKTTGDAGTTPLGAYTTQYMPWDRIGFGLDSTPPITSLTHDQAKVENYFLSLHRNHTPERYPTIVAVHFMAFTGQALSGWRGALLPIALLGVILLPGWVLATVGLQFLSYGLYAHARTWSLYYAELTPIIALGLGIGLVRTVGWLSRARVATSVESRWAVWLVAALIPATLLEVQAGHGREAEHTASVGGFRDRLSTVPDRSIVFVSYAADHNPHHALITNQAPRADQRVLTAYDQGDTTNAAIARALSRRPFRYTEADSSLRALDFTTSLRATPDGANRDRDGSTGAGEAKREFAVRLLLEEIVRERRAGDTAAPGGGGRGRARPRRLGGSCRGPRARRARRPTRESADAQRGEAERRSDMKASEGGPLHGIGWLAIRSGGPDAGRDSAPVRPRFRIRRRRSARRTRRGDRRGSARRRHPRALQRRARSAARGRATRPQVHEPRDRVVLR